MYDPPVPNLELQREKTEQSSYIQGKLTHTRGGGKFNQ